ARWAVAVMELGALRCTAVSPVCTACPLRTRCEWRRRDYPRGTKPRGQSYAGTDRQCRGRLLGMRRDADEPVDAGALRTVWDDHVQRERALDSLVADGLVEPVGDDHFRLPG